MPGGGDLLFQLSGHPFGVSSRRSVNYQYIGHFFFSLTYDREERPIIHECRPAFSKGDEKVDRLDEG
jgi:hypothetical protein